MAAVDHTASAINGAVSNFTTVATANEGTLVNAPVNARCAYVCCDTAMRIGWDLADGTALTTSNSILYAADTEHLVWLAGVSPGGRTRSVSGAPNLVIGTTTGSKVVAIRYCS